MAQVDLNRAGRHLYHETVDRVLQGPEAVKQMTEEVQHAAAELGEQAEPVAQKLVDEQLQPTAQYLAKNLEPEVIVKNIYMEIMK